MLDYFNYAIENFGEAIFNEDSKSEEIRDFVNSLDDAKCDVFTETARQGFSIQRN